METLGAIKEGKVHRHPQLGNINYLLEVELIRHGYFEREADGDLVYFSFGPRLRGEISTDGLVKIVDKVRPAKHDGEPVLAGLRFPKLGAMTEVWTLPRYSMARWMLSPAKSSNSAQMVCRRRRRKKKRSRVFVVRDARGV